MSDLMKIASTLIVSDGHKIRARWADYARDMARWADKSGYEIDLRELRRLWLIHVPVRRRTKPFGMATMQRVR